MKLNADQKSLLFEAMRRDAMADNHEKSKPLNKRWLGLGTASVYRPVLEAGLMAWHDGRPPAKRCMGWLVLTDAGVTALWDNRAELDPALTRLQADPNYQRSYLSSYSLAGGFTGGD